MTTALELTPLDEWRKRLGHKRYCDGPPRPLAAMGYLANGPVIEGLIEISRLMLVLLHDEPHDHGRPALRLTGFTGRHVPWGVQWGGPEQSRFFKDLLLTPCPDARGMRLDSGSTDLLRLGLQLERDLQRHMRFRRQCRHPQLLLPRLWAGFQTADAPTVYGGGPELTAYCQRIELSSDSALDRFRRHHRGLTLWPLAWVSHHWQEMTAVFADVKRFAQRQVFPLANPADDLVGYQGAAQYDFFHSRFRQAPVDRSSCQAVPASIAK